MAAHQPESTQMIKHLSTTLQPANVKTIVSISKLQTVFRQMVNSQTKICYDLKNKNLRNEVGLVSKSM